jgi:peroxiredoxin
VTESQPPAVSHAGDIRGESSPPVDFPTSEPVASALTRTKGGWVRAAVLVPILIGVLAVGLAVKLFLDSQAASTALPLPGAVSSAYKFTSGTPAPNFQLQTPEGQTVSLSDFRGKQVVLNFWATWCPPCRSEMPDMQQLYDERQDDLVVLAVDVQEAGAPVRRFTDQLGLSFPVVLDTGGEVTQSFGVQSLPTSFFIDREGRVAAFNMGALNKSAIAKKLDIPVQ